MRKQISRSDDEEEKTDLIEKYNLECTNLDDKYDLMDHSYQDNSGKYHGYIFTLYLEPNEKMDDSTMANISSIGELDAKDVDEYNYGDFIIITKGETRKERLEYCRDLLKSINIDLLETDTQAALKEIEETLKKYNAIFYVNQSCGCGCDGRHYDITIVSTKDPPHEPEFCEEQSAQHLFT